jgi:hypothetical protein
MGRSRIGLHKEIGLFHQPRYSRFKSTPLQLFSNIWKELLILVFFVPWLSGCTPPQENKPVETALSATPTVLRVKAPMPYGPFAFAPDGRVHLVWFYKPPAQGNIGTLASAYQSFILTRNDEPARDSLIAHGVRAPILRYLLLNAIQNPDSCAAVPLHNQVADEPGDFCDIQTYHPDWFLQGMNGAPMSLGGYWLMDPGNDGWRAYWLERMEQTQSQYRWDGVFLDNVDIGMDVLQERYHTGPAKYPNQEAYAHAISEFLRTLRDSYFGKEHHPLVANIVGPTEWGLWQRYIPYLDGAMVEAFAVDWTNGYLPPSEWQTQIELAWQMQAAGKAIFLIAQGDRSDLARERFSLASYLLIQNGDAFFRYTNDLAYESIWTYDNYSIDLGTPLSSPAADAQGIWHREFAHGSVIVDPIRHIAEIRVT